MLENEALVPDILRMWEREVFKQISGDFCKLEVSKRNRGASQNLDCWDTRATPLHTLSVELSESSSYLLRDHSSPGHMKCFCADPLQIQHACQRSCNPHAVLLEHHETSQNWSVLTFLTSKLASRCSCVPILDFGSSKSAPNICCFRPSVFLMCFSL